MKKFGLRALAGGLAALMVTTVFAPATVAKAADNLLIAPNPNAAKTLYVTEDMVDEDGEIVISGGNYDRIVVSKEAAAKDIYFDQVEVGELVVESGNKTNIQLWEVDAETVTVQEPKLAELKLQDLKTLLAEEETRQMALDLFVESRAKDEYALNTAPKIMTKEDAKVDEIVTRANAKLDLGDGEVGGVTLQASDTIRRADVTLSNYQGDVTYKGGDTYNVTNLRNVDSRIKTLTVDESTDVNRFNVTAKNAVVLEAKVSGNAKVSLNAPTGVIEVTEEATAADVCIFNAADELNVKADGAKVELAPNGSVMLATVSSDDVEITGKGTLTEASLDGKGAYVSTSGTKVEGENTYVPPVYVPPVEPVLPGTITDIDLVASGDVKITKNDDGSSNVFSDKQYQSATFVVPAGIDVSKLKSIKVTIESDRQCCIKVLDTEGTCLNDLSGYGGDFPNWGVTEMTAYTATYPIDASKNTVKQLDFMTTTTDPTNILVKSIVFTLAEDNAEDEVPLPDTVTFTYNDVTAKEGQGFAATLTDNNDGTVNISYAGQYSSAGFMLPEALNTETYTHVKVDGTATGSIALKVWKVGEVADSGNPTITKYGYTFGEALSLSKIFGEEVDRVDITSMEAGISATIESITFAKSADLLKEEQKEEVKLEAPKDLPENYLVYDVATLAPDAELTDIEGLKISFDKQYAGKNFTLPATLNVKDYSQMIITMSSTTDDVAFKVFADAETGAWYDKSATATTDVSVDLSAVKDQESLIKQIGLMANNGACEVIFYRVAFVPAAPVTPSAPEYTEGPVAMGDGTMTADSGAKLLQNEDNSVTVIFPETNGWNGATYAVPNGITVADIESITVNYTTTAQFGIKTYDASGKTELDSNGDSDGLTSYPSWRQTEDGASRTEDYVISGAAGVAKVQILSIADNQPNVTINSIQIKLKESTVTPTVTVEIAEPAMTTLTLDDTLTLTATASDAEGTITWSSSKPEVATVDANGVVTPVGKGDVTITATCGTATDTVDLTVENSFYLKSWDSTQNKWVVASKDVPFSVTIVDDGNYNQTTIANIYLNGTNFADSLPSALKNDTTIYAAFQNLEGIRTYVESFEFQYVLTEATAKDGGSQYDPQSQSVVQAYSASTDSWGSGKYEWSGIGVPSEGSPKTTTKVINTSAMAEWTEETVGKVALQLMNGEAGSTAAGTYTVKINLK